MTMPTSYGAPGVYTSVQLTGPTPAPSAASPSVAGFACENWRGPTGVAIQCNNWADFVKYYGGFNTAAVPVLSNPYLAYEVYEYFANGGQTVWVQRIVSSGSPGASAAVTLKDQAATPQNTLTLTAGLLGVPGNVGTWGNQLFVSVTSAGTGRFNLNVYLGTPSTNNLVETWASLSMAPTDSRYAVAILNSPTQGSVWVVATAVTDATAPPANTPAVIASAQFTGGTDPGAPSAADRTAAMTQGTSPFDMVTGVLNMYMPGETTAAVINAAITYATTGRQYSFLVMDTPSAQTPAGAVSYLSTLTPVSPNAAIYYPWLYATNPSSANLQSTILLPPGGFVLGQMVTTDTNSGVWYAPAGLTTILANVVQAERKFSPADLGTLNSNNVNAIRTRANGQVVIWGTRTMQNGYASLYIPVQRTLNYIEAGLAQLMENYVFQPNAQQLWTAIAATCTAFLSKMLTAGAFPSSNPAQAFYVICDSSNNTPQTIASGVVIVTVGVALVTPAEFIQLNIQQFQSSGVTTTNPQT
jgi:uncharacterized protein